MSAPNVKSAEYKGGFPKYELLPPPDLPEYAFIGRSNVGKSSLINMLCNQKHLAKTSGTPGKTQLINFFLINAKWYMTDLPGYGYARVSKGQRKTFLKLIEDYLLNRETLSSVFLLIDARHDPLENDLDFLHFLGEYGVPFSLTFTKIDKLSNPQLQKNLSFYKRRLAGTWTELPLMFLTSAVTTAGRDEILQHIHNINKTLPTLGQQP